MNTKLNWGEPFWLSKARSYIGEHEIAGRKHNPLILQWWIKIRAPFTDDETPWCAAFVGGVLESIGIKSSRSAAARSYLKWGTRLAKPAVGCIAVLWRLTPSSSTGHVGFVVGKDKSNNLLILGGNQGNMVNIKHFPTRRVLSYRWPIGLHSKIDYTLPTVSTSESFSKNES